MGDFGILFSVIWGGILGILGIVFFIISYFMKKSYIKKDSNCTVKTTGKVINIIEHYEKRKDGMGGRSYYPEIEYYVNGDTVTQRSAVGTNPCRYVIGQSVELRYNPKMPAEIILDGDNLLKTVSTVFGIVSYILFALAAVGIIFSIVVLS